MRFGAAGKLELNYLIDPRRSLPTSHRKVAGFLAFFRLAMKRNDKPVAYVGVSFINVCARFSPRHRHVVMDEKVITLQRYAHEVDWLGESEFCSLLLRTFRSARD